jgi:hypothetical protein
MDGQVQYTVRTRGDGVTPAKTALNLPDEFEFTNGNFFDIYSKLVNAKNVNAKNVNPDHL